MEEGTFWPIIQNLFFVVGSLWREAIGIDYSQVSYTNTKLAMQAATFVSAVTLARLLFLWLGSSHRRNYRASSGHDYDNDGARGVLGWFFMALPYMLLVIPVGFIIVAISDPVIPRYREEKTFVEAHTRVIDKDISGSMMTNFRGSVPKSQVAMNSLLDFLKRRAGQGDRSSLWVFGSMPHLIQNFTVDEEVFYQQAYDAPWGVGRYDSESGDWSISFRYPYFAGDNGGTVLANVLNANIQQFDEDEEIQKNSSYYQPDLVRRSRSVLIITDAIVNDLERAITALGELGQRGIVPHLIWINENTNINSITEASPNVKVLLEAIQANGGRYFAVADETGFSEAYLAIDNLEKARWEDVRISFEASLYHVFVFMAFASLLAIIPLGLLVSALKSP